MAPQKARDAPQRPPACCRSALGADFQRHHFRMRRAPNYYTRTLPARRRETWNSPFRLEGPNFGADGQQLREGRRAISRRNDRVSRSAQRIRGRAENAPLAKLVLVYASGCFAGPAFRLDTKNSPPPPAKAKFGETRATSRTGAPISGWMSSKEFYKGGITGPDMAS